MTGVTDTSGDTSGVVLGEPTVADGAELWRIARDSGKLDLNASYTYLLWTRDFARTSAVARVDGEIAGFVTGFLRPSAPDTLLIWQVAVNERARGRGVAGKLLDHLVLRLASEVSYLETTVTPDNEASTALFDSFAKRWSADMSTEEVFSSAQFPDEHEPENLYRIGPLPRR